MKNSARVFLWLFGLVSALLLLTALAVFFSVSKSRRALEDYQAQLESRGESLDVAVLAPPKAPENNGTPAVLAALQSLRDELNKKKIVRIASGQKETTPGFATVMHRQDMAYGVSGGTKDMPWPEVAREHASLQPSLITLREAVKSPALMVDIDYSKTFSIPLEHVTLALSGAQYLSMDVPLRLQQGDTAGALADLEALLQLQRMTDQPLLICQLVRASILGIAGVTTWEFLQADNTTADQLQRLQKAWTAVRPMEVAPMLRMERAAALPAFDFKSVRAITGASSPSSSVLPTSLEEALSMVTFSIWSTVFRYADQRAFLENYQTLIDQTQPPENFSWLQLFATMKSLDDSMANAGLGRMFSKMLIPSLTVALERFATTGAQRELILTAIALRRYQLDHEQTLPPNLEALVPAYLPALPRDEFDGKLLRYRPEKTGYLLYSVGLNGTDENGDPASLPDRKSRSIYDRKDIVWPQPAPAKAAKSP